MTMTEWGQSIRLGLADSIGEDTMLLLKRHATMRSEQPATLTRVRRAARTYKVEWTVMRKRKDGTTFPVTLHRHAPLPPDATPGPWYILYDYEARSLWWNRRAYRNVQGIEFEFDPHPFPDEASHA